MPEEFIALHDLVVRVAVTGDAPQAPPPPVPSPESADAIRACAAARRFYAAVADGVDAALDDLLRDIACTVVARELRLAPADVAAIAATALARFAAEAPLALRAHPGDLDALAALALPVVGDVSLRRGDVVLELRLGSIDASLGARLDAVLAAR